MSTASKVTLLTSVCGTLGIIYYVHLTQVKDRERLHRGILRDAERQQAKRSENVYRLQQQQELAKVYRQKEAEEKQAD